MISVCLLPPSPITINPTCVRAPGLTLEQFQDIARVTALPPHQMADLLGDSRTHPPRSGSLTAPPARQRAEPNFAVDWEKDLGLRVPLSRGGTQRAGSPALGGGLRQRPGRAAAGRELPPLPPRASSSSAGRRPADMRPGEGGGRLGLALPSLFPLPSPLSPARRKLIRPRLSPDPQGSVRD